MSYTIRVTEKEIDEWIGRINETSGSHLILGRRNGYYAIDEAVGKSGGVMTHITGCTKAEVCLWLEGFCEGNGRK